VEAPFNPRAHQVGDLVVIDSLALIHNRFDRSMYRAQGRCLWRG
jgi:hypothetical protein